MKKNKLPPSITLQYLINEVKKQERKDKIIGYVYNDIYDSELKLLQLTNKDD